MLIKRYKRTKNKSVNPIGPNDTRWRAARRHRCVVISAMAATIFAIFAAFLPRVIYDMHTPRCRHDER